MPCTQPEVQDAFQELYDSLTTAYWAASTISDKDLLRGAADAIYDILTELEENDLQANSAKCAEVKALVDRINGKLCTIKDNIDSFLHNVAIAASVASAVAKALDKASTFFV